MKTMCPQLLSSFMGFFYIFYFIICGTNSPILWDKICYETNLYIGQNISTAMGGKCCVQWNKVSNILGENRPYHERNFLYIRQTIRAGWGFVPNMLLASEDIKQKQNERAGWGEASA